MKNLGVLISDRVLPLRSWSHDLLALHNLHSLYDLHDGLHCVRNLHKLHNHHELHNSSKGDVTILGLDIASLSLDLRPPRSLPLHQTYVSGFIN